MNKNKRPLWVKVVIGGVIICLLLLGSFVGYNYFTLKHTYQPSKNTFTHKANYIDPTKSLLSKDFKACNENSIVDYYNPGRAHYKSGKNGLRKQILQQYNPKDYTDSGYLNIRFVINCKGETGRYVIHENDLDLEPTTFNKDLVTQLFNITSSLKNWIPNNFNGESKDTYMYLSYRIENGKITEILP